MRISLLTASSESYWELMKKTAPNKLEYCMRHKYQLAAKVHYRVTEHLVAERIRYMLEELNNCDWLFFMGSDTLITNMYFRLESIIESFAKDKDFVIGMDVNGINNDVLLIRNCPETIAFLNEVINSIGKFPNDQVAMDRLFGDFPNLRVNKIHQKVFNAMPYWLYGYKNDGGGTWKPGDFVFHCPGLSFNGRLKVVDEILQKVVR